MRDYDWYITSVIEKWKPDYEIIGLSCITVLFLAMSLYGLTQATNINKTWEKHRKLLNDPRLQIKINALFGPRFNEWMNNHEAKQKAFNFQVTPVLVMEVGSRFVLY